MPSFNKVMIIGNLTRDPQLKQLPSQVTLAEFGIAMSRKYRTASGEDKEEVCFIDCTAFGRQAETIAQWCRKGKQLFVEGRLKYDTWEDRIGGAKRSKLSIVVENFQFLGSRDDQMSNSTTANTFDDRKRSESMTTTTTTAPAAPHPGEARRSERTEPSPPSRPQRGGRVGDRGKAKVAAPEQPFGEEKVFHEADIPF